MLAKVTSCAVVGLDGVLIEVEVDIARGLPSMTIVGLPDTAVQESRERVRAAIKNSGLPFPSERVTVNLAPADIRKAGPAYDLPIAIGILLASQQIFGNVEQAIVMGELSLDGGGAPRQRGAAHGQPGQKGRLYHPLCACRRCGSGGLD
jgi:magnesium chelatase family protein